VICSARPRETSRSFSIGCGEGLGEAQFSSVKTTSDWAKDLFSLAGRLE